MGLIPRVSRYRLGGEHHRELASFDPATAAFNASDAIEGGGELVEQLETLLGTAHLATAVTDRHLDLLPRLEKAAGVAQLHLEVVTFRSRAQLDLFDFDRVLASPRVAGTLLLFILELPPIHDAHDRGTSLRGDLDQVETTLHCILAGDFDGDDAELGAFGIDQTDGADADRVVDSCPVCGDDVPSSSRTDCPSTDLMETSYNSLHRTARNAPIGRFRRG